MGHLIAIGSTEWGNRQSGERLSDGQAHRSTCISTAQERSTEAHTYGEVQEIKRAEGAGTDRFIKTDAEGRGWGGVGGSREHKGAHSNLE